MFILEELFRYKTLSPLRFTLGVVEDHLRDIRFAMEQVETVTVSNFFPFLDFQYHQEPLLFVPQKYTTLPFDLISLAAYHGRTEMVAGLLSLFTTSTTGNKCINLSAPLALSILNKQTETAELLLDRGADPRGEGCTNGLHAAARAGLEDMISDFIVNRKVPVDSVDGYGATPVIYALYLPEEQATATIAILFYHGASPKSTFGPKSTTYACFAKAMGKRMLAQWLQQTETESFCYAIDFIQKQTQELHLDEGEDTDWDYL